MSVHTLLSRIHRYAFPTADFSRITLNSFLAVLLPPFTLELRFGRANLLLNKKQVPS